MRQGIFMQSKFNSIDSLRDDNCAFNCFSMAFCDLILAKELKNYFNNGHYQLLLSKIQKKLGVKTWEEFKDIIVKWDQLQRQTSLAPVFRELVYELRTSSKKHKQGTLNAFLSSFREYVRKKLKIHLKEGGFEGDDIYSRIPKVKEQFQLNFEKIITTLNQSTMNSLSADELDKKITIQYDELKSWFEIDGQQIFDDELKKNKVWAGDLELVLLAKKLNINLMILLHGCQNFVSLHSSNGCLPDSCAENYRQIFLDRSIVDRAGNSKRRYKLVNLDEQKVRLRLGAVEKNEPIYKYWEANAHKNEIITLPDEWANDRELLKELLGRKIVWSDYKTKKYYFHKGLNLKSRLDAVENFEVVFEIWKKSFIYQPTIFLKKDENHYFYFQPCSMQGLLQYKKKQENVNIDNTVIRSQVTQTTHHTQLERARFEVTMVTEQSLVESSVQEDIKETPQVKNEGSIQKGWFETTILQNYAEAACSGVLFPDKDIVYLFNYIDPKLLQWVADGLARASGFIFVLPKATDAGVLTTNIPLRSLQALCYCFESGQQLAIFKIAESLGIKIQERLGKKYEEALKSPIKNSAAIAMCYLNLPLEQAQLALPHLENLLGQKCQGDKLSLPNEFCYIKEVSFIEQRVRALEALNVLIKSGHSLPESSIRLIKKSLSYLNSDYEFFYETCTNDDYIKQEIEKNKKLTKLYKRIQSKQEELHPRDIELEIRKKAIQTEFKDELLVMLQSNNQDDQKTAAYILCGFEIENESKELAAFKEVALEIIKNDIYSVKKELGPYKLKEKALLALGLAYKNIKPLHEQIQAIINNEIKQIRKSAAKTLANYIQCQFTQQSELNAEKLFLDQETESLLRKLFYDPDQDVADMAAIVLINLGKLSEVELPRLSLDLLNPKDAPTKSEQILGTIRDKKVVVPRESYVCWINILKKDEFQNEVKSNILHAIELSINNSIAAGISVNYLVTQETITIFFNLLKDEKLHFRLSTLFYTISQYITAFDKTSYNKLSESLILFKPLIRNKNLQFSIRHNFLGTLCNCASNKQILSPELFFTLEEILDENNLHGDCLSILGSAAENFNQRVFPESLLIKLFKCFTKGTKHHQKMLAVLLTYTKATQRELPEILISELVKDITCIEVSLIFDSVTENQLISAETLKVIGDALTQNSANNKYLISAIKNTLKKTEQKSDHKLQGKIYLQLLNILENSQIDTQINIHNIFKLTKDCLPLDVVKHLIVNLEHWLEDIRNLCADSINNYIELHLNKEKDYQAHLTIFSQESLGRSYSTSLYDKDQRKKLITIMKNLSIKGFSECIPSDTLSDLASLLLKETDAEMLENVRTILNHARASKRTPPEVKELVEIDELSEQVNSPQEIQTFLRKLKELVLNNNPLTIRNFKTLGKIIFTSKLYIEEGYEILGLCAQKDQQLPADIKKLMVKEFAGNQTIIINTVEKIFKYGNDFSTDMASTVEKWYIDNNKDEIDQSSANLFRTLTLKGYTLETRILKKIAVTLAKSKDSKTTEHCAWILAVSTEDSQNADLLQHIEITRLQEILEDPNFCSSHSSIVSYCKKFRKFTELPSALQKLIAVKELETKLRSAKNESKKNTINEMQRMSGNLLLTTLNLLEEELKSDKNILKETVDLLATACDENPTLKVPITLLEYLGNFLSEKSQIEKILTILITQQKYHPSFSKDLLESIKDILSLPNEYLNSLSLRLLENAISKNLSTEFAKDNFDIIRFNSLYQELLKSNEDSKLSTTVNTLLTILQKEVALPHSQVSFLCNLVSDINTEKVKLALISLKYYVLHIKDTDQKIIDHFFNSAPSLLLNNPTYTLDLLFILQEELPLARNKNDIIEKLLHIIFSADETLREKSLDLLMNLTIVRANITKQQAESLEIYLVDGMRDSKISASIASKIFTILGYTSIYNASIYNIQLLMHQMVTRHLEKSAWNQFCALNKENQTNLIASLIYRDVKIDDIKSTGQFDDNLLFAELISIIEKGKSNTKNVLTKFDDLINHYEHKNLKIKRRYFIKLLINQLKNYSLTENELIDLFSLLNTNHKTVIYQLHSSTLSKEDWLLEVKLKWLQFKLSLMSNLSISLHKQLLNRFLNKINSSDLTFTLLNDIFSILSPNQDLFKLEHFFDFLRRNISLCQQDISDAVASYFKFNEPISIDVLQNHIGYIIIEKKLKLKPTEFPMLGKLLLNGWEIPKLIDLLEKILSSVTPNEKFNAQDYLTIIYYYQLSQKDFDKLLNIFSFPPEERIHQLNRLILSTNSQDDIQDKPLITLIEEYNNNTNNEYKLTAEDIKILEDKNIRSKGSLISKHAKESGLTTPIQKWDKGNIQSWSNHVKEWKLFPSSVPFTEVLAVINRVAYLYFLDRLGTGFELRNSQLLALVVFFRAQKSHLSQIETSEGKTIITANLAVIGALQNLCSDVLTSSPLLAKRDALEYKDLYLFFNLSADNNCDDNYKQSGIKECYKKTVVYGEASQFEFDILRTEFQNLDTRKGRPYQLVIADECDYLMIDECNKITMLSEHVPGMEQILIIFRLIWLHIEEVNKPQLDETSREILTKEIVKVVLDRIILDKKDEHVEFNESKRFKISPHLKNHIITQLQRWIKRAIEAQFDYHCGTQYLLGKDNNGKEIICPVDASNGCTLLNNNWDDGLHQFLQMKHNLNVTPPSLTTNYLSNKEFLTRYQKAYGLTGTLGSARARLFLMNNYKDLTFSFIPRHKPKRLTKYPPIFVNSKDDLYKAIINSVRLETARNRAILLFVRSVKKADTLCKILSSQFTESSVKRYTRSDSLETRLVDHPLNPGDIIVSTALGGRGTEFKLPTKITANCGLHVAIALFSSNSRQKKQNAGRAARKSDPGSVQHIIKLPKTTKVYDPINTLKTIKRIRDQLEREQLDKFENEKSALLDKKSDLFKRFCELRKKISDKKLKNQPSKPSATQRFIFDTELFYQLKAVEERWGLWLKNINEHKDVDKEFSKFEQQIEEDLEKDKVIENPAYYLCLANAFIEYIKNCWFPSFRDMSPLYIKIASLSGRARKIDPYLSQAFPIKAYALLNTQLSSLKEKKKSPDDIKNPDNVKQQDDIKKPNNVKQADYKTKAKVLLLKASRYLLEQDIPQVECIMLSMDPKRKFFSHFNNQLSTLKIHYEYLSKMIAAIDKSKKLFDLEILETNDTLVNIGNKTACEQVSKYENSMFNIHFHDLKIMRDCRWKLRKDAYSVIEHSPEQCKIDILFKNIPHTEVIKLIPKHIVFDKIIAKRQGDIKFNDENAEHLSTKKRSFISATSDFFRSLDLKLKLDSTQDIPVDLTICGIQIDDLTKFTSEQLQKISNIVIHCYDEETQQLIISLIDPKAKVSSSDFYKFINENRSKLIQELIKLNDQQDANKIKLAYTEFNITFSELDQITAIEIINNLSKFKTTHTPHKNVNLRFSNLNKDMANKIVYLNEESISYSIISVKNINNAMALNLLNNAERPEESFRDLVSHSIDNETKLNNAEDQVNQFKLSGLKWFFTLEEKNPIPIGSITIIGTIVLIQAAVATGLIFVTSAAALPFAIGLYVDLTGDIAVLIRAAYTGQINWKVYLITKGISLTTAMLTAGVSAIRIGRVAIETIEIIATTSERFIEVAKSLGIAFTQKIGAEVITNTANAFLDSEQQKLQIRTRYEIRATVELEAKEWENYFKLIFAVDNFNQTCKIGKNYGLIAEVNSIFKKLLHDADSLLNVLLAVPYAASSSVTSHLVRNFSSPFISGLKGITSKCKVQDLLVSAVLNELPNYDPDLLKSQISALVEVFKSKRLVNPDDSLNQSANFDLNIPLPTNSQPSGLVTEFIRPDIRSVDWSNYLPLKDIVTNKLLILFNSLKTDYQTLSKELIEKIIIMMSEIALEQIENLKSLIVDGAAAAVSLGIGKAGGAMVSPHPSLEMAAAITVADQVVDALPSILSFTVFKGLEFTIDNYVAPQPKKAFVSLKAKPSSISLLTKTVEQSQTNSPNDFFYSQKLSEILENYDVTTENSTKIQNDSISHLRKALAFVVHDGLDCFLNNLEENALFEENHPKHVFWMTVLKGVATIPLHILELIELARSYNTLLAALFEEANVEITLNDLNHILTNLAHKLPKLVLVIKKYRVIEHGLFKDSGLCDDNGSKLLKEILLNIANQEKIKTIVRKMLRPPIDRNEATRLILDLIVSDNYFLEYLDIKRDAILNFLKVDYHRTLTPILEKYIIKDELLNLLPELLKNIKKINLLFNAYLEEKPVLELGNELLKLIIESAPICSFFEEHSDYIILALQGYLNNNPTMKQLVDSYYCNEEILDLIKELISCPTTLAKIVSHLVDKDYNKTLNLVLDMLTDPKLVVFKNKLKVSIQRRSIDKVVASAIDKHENIRSLLQAYSAQTHHVIVLLPLLSYLIDKVSAVKNILTAQQNGELLMMAREALALLGQPPIDQFDLATYFHENLGKFAEVIAASLNIPIEISNLIISFLSSLINTNNLKFTISILSEILDSLEEKKYLNVIKSALIILNKINPLIENNIQITAIAQNLNEIHLKTIIDRFPRVAQFIDSGFSIMLLKIMLKLLSPDNLVILNDMLKSLPHKPEVFLDRFEQFTRDNKAILQIIMADKDIFIKFINNIVSRSPNLKYMLQGNTNSIGQLILKIINDAFNDTKSWRKLLLSLIDHIENMSKTKIGYNALVKILFTKDLLITAPISLYQYFDAKNPDRQYFINELLDYILKENITDKNIDVITAACLELINTKLCRQGKAKLDLDILCVFDFINMVCYVDQIAIFSKIIFNNKSFVSSYLSNLSFNQCSFSDCSFLGTTFNNIKIIGGQMDVATFVSLIPALKAKTLQLNAIKLTGDLRDVDLTGLSLKGFDLSEISSFTNTNLNRTDLTDVKLPKNFAQCIPETFNMDKTLPSGAYDCKPQKPRVLQKVISALAQKLRAVNVAIIDEARMLSELQSWDDQTLVLLLDTLQLTPNDILESNFIIDETKTIHCSEYLRRTTDILAIMLTHYNSTANMRRALLFNTIAYEVIKKLFGQGDNRGKDGLTIKHIVFKVLFRYFDQHPQQDPVIILHGDRLSNAFTETFKRFCRPTFFGLATNFFTAATKDGGIQLQADLRDNPMLLRELAISLESWIAEQQPKTIGHSGAR